jgi:hypothetical protein
MSTKPTIEQRAYFDAVRDALTAFQMIEESLKMSISTCYMYIRSKVKDQVPFAYGRDDVDNLPLGALLEIYRRLTPNEDLIAALRALPKDRNYVAHQAFVKEVLLSDEPPEQLVIQTGRIEKIAENARAVLAILIDEMNRLVACIRSTLGQEAAS